MFFNMNIKRLWLWLPALVWMSVIFYLSSQTGPGGPEWQAVVFHIVAYSLLASLYWLGLRGTTDTPKLYAVLIVIVLATLYGISDEWHQSFTPGRRPDPYDVMVDAAAAAGAALALAAISNRPTKATGEPV